MKRKKIAVFMPCYNASATIRETLQSVEKATTDIGFPVPLYIYDDGSKDDSLAIASATWSNPDTLIIRRNETNMGERKTTNMAFGYFSGRYDWVLIIHADDIVKEKWLSEIYGQINDLPEENFFTVWSSFDSLDGATGRIIEGDNSGQIRVSDRTEAEKKHYLIRLYSSWHVSGAAIHVPSYMKLEGFDTSMAQFGDTDFFVRALLAGYRDLYISKTLTYYRVVASSVSSTSVRTNRDIKEVIYLLSKFRGILNEKERKQLRNNLTALSFRRSCRWLLHRDWRNFVYCSSIAFRSLIGNPK